MRARRLGHLARREHGLDTPHRGLPCVAGRREQRGLAHPCAVCPVARPAPAASARLRTHGCVRRADARRHGVRPGDHPRRQRAPRADDGDAGQVRLAGVHSGRHLSRVQRPECGSAHGGLDLASRERAAAAFAYRCMHVRVHACIVRGRRERACYRGRPALLLVGPPTLPVPSTFSSRSPQPTLCLPYAHHAVAGWWRTTTTTRCSTRRTSTWPCTP